MGKDRAVRALMEPLEERRLLSAFVAKVGDAFNPLDWKAAASSDDRFVAFTSTSDLQDQYPDDDSAADVFVRDNLTGQIELISRANGKAAGGWQPGISADGRYVTFSSSSDQIITGFLDRNQGPDVFVYDRFNSTFVRASIPPAAEAHDFPGQFGKTGTHEGAFRPAISADGRFVAFETDPLAPTTTGNFDVYLRDLTAGSSFLVARNSTSEWVIGFLMDSAAKRIAILSVTSSSDTLSGVKIKVLDLTNPAAASVLHTVSIAGPMAPFGVVAALSPDGKWLFYSVPSLSDVAAQQQNLHPKDLHQVDLDHNLDTVLIPDSGISVPADIEETATIVASENGQRLLYTSASAIYLYDRAFATPVLISYDDRGFVPLQGKTLAPVISGDGRRAYFLNNAGQSGSFNSNLYRSDDLNVGRIQGRIWSDGNGNSLQDPGESPRVTSTVFLDLNNSGAFDSGEPIAITDADGIYSFTGLSTGSYTVRPLIPTDSVLSFPAPASQFNIELTFSDDFPDWMKPFVREAADRWMKIIVGDLPDVGDIDDMRILVNTGQLDINTLAVGGPTAFRSDSGLPYTGTVTFSDNFGNSSIGVRDVAIHEIAHALGFGTLWGNLIQVFGGLAGYTGRGALAMYRLAVNAAANYIPVEPDAGDPTRGTHWASSWAATNDEYFEVMSAYFHRFLKAKFISPITVASMQDLGYQVNYAGADLDGLITKDKYFVLRKDAPLGADAKSYTATIAPGQMQGGLDFGVKLKSVTFATGPKPPVNGTISGISFIDANRNGRKDRGEAVLKCTIFFDLDRDGVLDSNEPRIKLKTGSYRFTHVPEGTWRLGVLLPKGLKLAPVIKPVKITASKPNVKLNLIARRK